MSGHVMRAGDLLARHIDARFEGIEGTLPA
jgi:hypothetical protein